jgi:hypothetical protein
LIHLEDNPAVAKRNAEISFVLFVLGGVVGLVNLNTTLPFGKGFEMYALATNLATHGAYANPFLVLATGPSAVAPPLYPLLLALFMKVLRAPAFVLLAAALGNVIANALAAALLPRVSWLFFGNAVPGIAAAVFWLMAAQLMPSWDASYTVAALLFFCLFSAATVGKKRVIFSGVSTGLLAGALLLLNPVSLLVFVPWLVHLLVLHQAAMKHTAAYCCIVLGTAALVVFPWTLRNYHQFGSFLVRTGLGLNIYISNNDCSRTSMFEDLHSGCAAIYQPDFNLREARAVRDLGELDYDHQRMAEAEAWMRAHPDRFLHLTVSRFFAFWFPPGEEHPFKAGVIRVFTLLSIPGLALMAYRRVRVTAFTLFVLSVYPLVYYVVVSEIRFRYPILWLSMLPAGYFVHWLVQRAEVKWKWWPVWSKTPTGNSASPC